MKKLLHGLFFLWTIIDFDMDWKSSVFHPIALFPVLNQYMVHTTFGHIKTAKSNINTVAKEIFEHLTGMSFGEENVIRRGQNAKTHLDGIIIALTHPHSTDKNWRKGKGSLWDHKTLYGPDIADGIRLLVRQYHLAGDTPKVFGHTFSPPKLEIHRVDGASNLVVRCPNLNWSQFSLL